ncbi:Rab7, putative [Acanthamoeba castellanii str. Neff]|uniref:Rab7, putative n=1 Tax=Acanthamoeba castellanii (strain ATCC 30010 / Neff) TaxID=1257118 RepID=L8HEH5_ACACF|nr:Rab7, putative [Acanthamoeba castellanii str. Neff]ELR23934.1 Rab7, putative [Acanthamoeba castellanii str. Neff]
MANTKTKPCLKIIALGDSQYVLGRFGNYAPTIGPDFRTKELLIDDVVVCLQVWDTAGQERFDSLGRAFYRGTNVCVLVYDITNPRSLERLDHWKRMYEESMPAQAEVDRTVFGVFANKMDMEGQRKVSQIEAETWCRENGDMPHFSVSAKDGDGVEQAFNTLAKKAKRILDEWNQQQPVEDRTYLSDVNADDTGEQPCQC